MIQETSLNQHRSLYIYTDQNSYEPLARIDKRGNDPEKVMYFHTDLNGCPEELTDENGKILWECSFQLWGKRIHEIEHEPIKQNLRYQGQYLDRETGLHYNTFRYYDPDIGRFTQPDPIGLLGGFNLYQYAPNGLTWIDPWGLSCVKWNGRAQRFYGKNGRFISRAESAKSIRINPQKQAGHIQGTPQYNNRVKQGKPTSAFDSQSDVDKLVRNTLEYGNPVPNQPGKFDLETGSPVGTGPNGGAQTKVRVHVDSKGEAHGHPAGKEL
jgi:RHS repeat-associated protein